MSHFRRPTWTHRPIWPIWNWPFAIWPSEITDREFYPRFLLYIINNLKTNIDGGVFIFLFVPAMNEDIAASPRIRAARPTVPSRSIVSWLIFFSIRLQPFKIGNGPWKRGKVREKWKPRVMLFDWPYTAVMYISQGFRDAPLIENRSRGAVDIALARTP